MRLEVVGVSVHVEGRSLLADISVACRPGGVTGVLGPNGSGKTTLLHVIAGLRRPSAGLARLGERDIHTMGSRARARLMAIVEQNAMTNLNLTAREVVALGRIPHRRAWMRADQRGANIVEQSLELVDAVGYADTQWHKLSGGERQRVHLARALAQEPKILLLDEPTNHLDLAQQLRFLERVRNLGVTCVVALHDLNLASAYCDDVAILSEGRLAAHGPTASVLVEQAVADVYRVDVTVEPHPVREHPHLRWNRPLEEG